MIVYANGKVIATDTEGNTQPIGVVGAEQDEIKVSDHEQENLLTKMLKELKKMNLHLTILSDENIRNNDVEV
jgi:hypothetical protein